MEGGIGSEIAGYRIESEIGRGGMGVVYLAHQAFPERRVALKVLSPELASDPAFRERFIHESNAAASTEHPNIVPVYGAGEADGQLYLAMRYVEGTDLRSLLEREGPFDSNRAARICAEVAEALEAAHERGLVHRDVKPGNVLLDARERAYLSDFGLIRRTRIDTGITKTGQFIGTVDYVAPEQIKGGQLDGRADIYSLGCVLYECLTGAAPFRRDSEVATMYAQLEEPVPVPSSVRSEVPRAMDAVVATATAKLPDDRFATAGEMAEALRGGAARPDEARKHHVRQRIAIGAALIALAVVAALIAIPIVGRNEASSEIEPNSVGVLDPESGEVIATVGLEDRPGAVASSGDAVWVTHPDAGTVTRIDPIEQAIVDTIQVGENPTGIAVGEDALWVVESGGPSVSRISPDTNTVVGDAIEVGNGPAGVAVGEGAVWVTNRFDGTISRIDPSSGEVIDLPIGPDPQGIAVGFGSVWVGLAGSNTVVRVDAQTNDVTGVIGVGNAPGSLAVSADAVWVANTLDDTVSEISPDTNSVVDAIGVGDGPSGIAVVGGIVWVANEADGTLSRIESGQIPVRTIVIESVPQGLDGVNGDLWVTVRGTATSHRGGTLRLVSLDPFLSLDPGLAYDTFSWTALHLLGDGLVAFEPIGGTNATLVPDLATSIPTPTDGGRMYTFELRPGIRYSNGEVVAPGDFRRAIERGFPLDEVAHNDLYGGLVGGEACGREPETCDLSEGIVTDDASGTITFHLVAPDSEFPYKLTLPFAYPVPPSTPDGHQLEEGVPGTGPYMLEAPMTDEGVSLVRNPDFRLWSPAAQPDGYVDRLEWTFGVEPEAQVEAVVAGDADVAFEAFVSDRLEELLVEFPAQVHTSLRPSTFYVVLNTTVPPFDDVQVRRAINLALDRDRVVQILGGEAAALPTCQHLPPNFPGYEPYCPYTTNPGPEGSWTAPDLQQARSLVRRSGTAGMQVVFEYPVSFYNPWRDRFGRYMIEMLDDLGYRGSAMQSNVYNPGNNFQMAQAAWLADYPAASTMIVNHLTCDASQTPLSGFCDGQIDSMVDRAIEAQADDATAAGGLWAEIDREIVDEAPFLWLVNPIAVEFVSERVGNYQWSLQWGGLLNQLWVR